MDGLSSETEILEPESKPGRRPLLVAIDSDISHSLQAPEFGSNFGEEPNAVIPVSEKVRSVGPDPEETKAYPGSSPGMVDVHVVVFILGNIFSRGESRNSGLEMDVGKPEGNTCLAAKGDADIGQVTEISIGLRSPKASASLKLGFALWRTQGERKE